MTTETSTRIPRIELRAITEKKIIELYQLDYSYNNICHMLSVSKSTVMKAVSKFKGRNHQ